MAVAESAAAVQRAKGGMVRVRVQGVQVRNKKARRQRKAHRQGLEQAQSPGRLLGAKTPQQ
jgi:hypothetical protein